MKIIRVGQKIYSKVKSGAKQAFAPRKPDVTGLLPNSLKKAPSTGLTTAQLIDLIIKGLI